MDKLTDCLLRTAVNKSFDGMTVHFYINTGIDDVGIG
jgi:hypothetical protein